MLILEATERLLSAEFESAANGDEKQYVQNAVLENLQKIKIMPA